MGDVYYNEIDPYCATWLRRLMAGGQIPKGVVDERDIRDVRPSELDKFTQCHFFAGIGGWAYALRLAGWPTDRPIWTGSCPCQPFSVAGKRMDVADERHLWPAFRWLIAQCRPATVIGEQVAQKAGRAWLAGVRADLEAMGYAVGAADLCAACAGAPHIRQRLFWLADASGSASERDTRKLPTAKAERCSARPFDGNLPKRFTDGGKNSGGLADAERDGRRRDEQERGQEGRATDRGSGAWSDFYLVQCTDGRQRRVGAGVFPLAYGIPAKLGPELAGIRGLVRRARRNRQGTLRGYGNAIVPQVAAEFVRSWLQKEQGQ